MNTSTNVLKTKKTKTIIITLLAASTIFMVISYNGSQMRAKANSNSAPKQAKVVDEAETIITKVSVQETLSGDYQAQVVGFGEAVSRYELNYTSEISGRVTWVSDKFETGVHVAKDDLLATIDDTTYQQLVAEAQSNLATAELELLEEEREGQQARTQWKNSGLKGEPSSPLVFRTPQLTSAKANVENAKKALESAQQDLAYTQIKAPFDGIITARNIQPGAHVSIGGDIGMLYSTDRLDIEVPLSQQQWENLPSRKTDELWPAIVHDSNSNTQWDAEVERTHQYFDKVTRQRSLILTVKKPVNDGHILLPGMFVKAEITGKLQKNIWQLPSSALSQQSEIWIVDDQGLLKKFPVSILFEQGNYIYITPVIESDAALVVLRPLSNFQVDMKVSPQIVTEGTY